MPPAMFYAMLLAGAALQWLWPQNVPLLPRAWQLGLGGALGGAGCAFMMVAHRQFKLLGTNVRTDRPACRLVAEGAYALSRNPMYVGGVGLFLGLALVAGSLWLLVAGVPLGIYLACRVVPREEAYMTRAFGAAYAHYRQQVRRWL
ncbi:methyltransferase family protein [Megalodesulfovibrio paquesii]